MQAAIYLIDDESQVRAALTDLLASVGLNIQSFANVEDFLARAVKQDLPSCLLLDVRMPGQSGLDFFRHLQEHGWELPVIFITGHGDIRMAVQAIKQGAIEFLSKPFRDQELLEALYQGIEQDRKRRAEQKEQIAHKTLWQSLTEGEQKVLQGVVEGLLNKQIAHRLNLSEITIKVRRSHAMRKLQLRTVPELVRFYEKVQAD